MNKSKSKLKYILIVGLFAVLFMFGIGTATSLSATPVYAATGPLYTVPFSYTLYGGVYFSSATVEKQSESDVYQSSKMQCGDGTYNYLNFQVYGTSYSGTANYTSSDYIGSSTVNIKTNSGFATSAYTIKNSAGTVVATASTQNCTINSLSTGTYTVEYIGGTEWKEDGNIRDHPRALKVVATFQFRVDITKPTMSGASTSTTGKYTNTAFTVSASDSHSGIANIYWRDPSSSTYSSITATSKTISAGSINGLYSFYAVDKVGNQSSIYYVYYDNVKPTGAIKNSNGTTISGYTSGSFYYTATDNASGVSYCQYQTPGSTTWATYTSGTTISTSATKGAYNFRCVDKSGNVSNTSSIILDTTAPSIVLYSGSTTVTSGTKATAASIKAVASDGGSGVKTIYVKTPGASAYSTYTNSTAMTTNGTYYFYAIDNAGNTSAMVNISLDNTKPVITSSIGSNGGTVNGEFTITATDNIGTPQLYYKVAGASSYTLCSGTEIRISKTQPNGVYSFYAVDEYGNTSDTFSLTLSISAPSVQIIRPSNGNIACVVWSDANCSATLNGQYYSSGTWITTEGDYTFVLTNDANRETALNFSIDHYYVKGDTVSPTCTNQGYTIYTCQNCGDSYNADFVEALGHSYSTSVIVPTCEAEGYTLHTCSKCGHSYKDTYTDILGHTYNDWYIVTAPTCTATGTSRRDCSDCDHYEIRTDKALGHNYEATVVSATCTVQGYTVHTCSRCKSSYNDTYVESTGHSYIDYVTKPTCTERGFITHTCSECQISYVDTYTDALGHDFGSWYTTKGATCVDTGSARRDCSSCSYNEMKIIQPLGHDYKIVVTNPTCLEKGFTTYTCERCKQGYIDDWVNALEHSYEEEIIAPSCMEDGYTLHKCKRCDDSYTTDEVSKLGHNYIENYIDVTCEQAGGVLHTCLRCGNEYMSDIVNPTGHDYETSVVLYATCDKEGERSFHCLKCGESYTEVIPAKGHQFTVVDSEHSDGKVYRSYTCAICAYSYETVIGEEYEQVSNYVEHLFQEYSPYMVWVFLATAGVWSIAMGISLIVAKKNEDQVKAKKMIANYVVGLVAIFIILVAAPYLVRGIAFLVS